MFHADRVIIVFQCCQGQLSRTWKVQCDWLSLGNECCTSLSRRFTVGKDEIAWKANGGGATGECSDTYSTYIETSLERQIGS